MENPQLVCIDFGSSYTKVAFRREWSAPAVLVRDIPLAPQDPNFCIPSVVARVERVGGVKWAVGDAAAGQVRGEGVSVFQHWKDSLFSEQATQQEYDVATEVGLVFFRELRETLSQLGLPVVSCPVRLCVPHLGENATRRERVLELLSRAGWRLASNRPTLYEPESVRKNGGERGA